MVEFLGFNLIHQLPSLPSDEVYRVADSGPDRAVHLHLSPEEVRKHSRWGPIDFLMVYCCVISERKMSFNFAMVIRQKISAKNLYCAGVGWVDGRQFGFVKFPQF